MKTVLPLQEQGIAGIKATREELTRQAETIIKNARESASLMMKEGLIAPYHEE